MLVLSFFVHMLVFCVFVCLCEHACSVCVFACMCQFYVKKECWYLITE